MIIDSHTHILDPNNFDKKRWMSNKMIPPTNTPIETYVKWWKEAGIKKACGMGQDMTRIWNSNIGEDRVLEAYNKYKDFFIPFASIEPIDEVGKLNRNKLKHFENSIKKGIRGLLITPPYGQYHANDRRLYPFYELAQNNNIVVQYHMGGSDGPPVMAHLKYSRLVDLNDVVVDFPDLKVVVEHMAFPWTEELFVIMAGNPNMYTDTAMLYSQPTLTAWRFVMAKEYKIIDRVMFAIDYFSEITWKEMQATHESIIINIIKGYIKYIREGVNEVCQKSGWPILTNDDIEGILWANANKLYNLGLE